MFIQRYVVSKIRAGVHGWGGYRAGLARWVGRGATGPLGLRRPRPFFSFLFRDSSCTHHCHLTIVSIRRTLRKRSRRRAPEPSLPPGLLGCTAPARACGQALCEPRRCSCCLPESACFANALWRRECVSALMLDCLCSSARAWLASRMGDTKIPSLIWAQRREKVFVTWEMLSTTGVSVTFTDGLLSLEGTGKGQKFKLENLPLWSEIDAEESKWFSNDRCAAPLLLSRRPPPRQDLHTAPNGDAVRSSTHPVTPPHSLQHATAKPCSPRHPTPHPMLAASAPNSDAVCSSTQQRTLQHTTSESASARHVSHRFFDLAWLDLI